MGYTSPPFPDHIHGPGIREGVCSLLVDPWERVPCPTWSESGNTTTPKETENLYHIASLRETAITTESSTPKICYLMMIK